MTKTKIVILVVILILIVTLCNSLIKRGRIIDKIENEFSILEKYQLEALIGFSVSSRTFQRSNDTVAYAINFNLIKDSNNYKAIDDLFITAIFIKSRNAYIFNYIRPSKNNSMKIISDYKGILIDSTDSFLEYISKPILNSTTIEYRTTTFGSLTFTDKQSYELYFIPDAAIITKYKKIYPRMNRLDENWYYIFL